MQQQQDCITFTSEGIFASLVSRQKGQMHCEDNLLQQFHKVLTWI